MHVLTLKFLNEDDSFPKKICFRCEVKPLASAVKKVQEVSRTRVVCRQLSMKDQEGRVTRAKKARNSEAESFISHYTFREH